MTIDNDSEGVAAIAIISRNYQDNFGMITPMIADRLCGMVDDYPREWVAEAMRLAVHSEKRNLRYVEGILKNWKREGFNTNGRVAKSEADEWERIRAKYADEDAGS